jgi:hypothetical protein
MRFMMMVKGTKEYEAGAPPNPELMAAMGTYTEERAKAGIFLDGGGLKPSRYGARLQLASGKISVVDGPFAEAKEVIGGWAICELPSKEAAIEMAREFLEIHRQILGDSYEVESEVRQIEDFV